MSHNKIAIAISVNFDILDCTSFCELLNVAL